jgi:hypothetical protein
VDFRLGGLAPDAAVHSAELPAAALRDEAIAVPLTFENTGESTWRRRDGYRLRDVTCPTTAGEAASEMKLTPGESIPPGDTHTFTLSLQLPDEHGWYEVGWRMCQDGGRGFFGESVQGTISVSSFLDVPADHWALEEVEAAAAAGVVHGYADHRYCPEWPVTRDQMAVYLARALTGGDEAVPPGPEAPTFADVPADHWAYRYIEYVESADIAHGYDDGGYHPAAEVDRAQMAVFVARAIAGGQSELASYEPEGGPTFPDVPTDAWSYKEVEYIVGQEVVAGYPDGLYHPERLCTRGQMAVYVTRAFELD